MGKTDFRRHPAADLEQSVVPSGCAAASRIGRAVSLRCAVAVILSLSLLLSAIFCLPFFPRLSRFLTPDADALSADIQAGFILQTPFSKLLSHIGRLEYDILQEIGVPNSKILIISMDPLATTNSIHVVFSVVPNSKDMSISLPALSVLRSCLIDLVLQQVNLSLTPSIFGQPSSFEVLKFPGGITVIPGPSTSIWERTQILFYFTLNNSIIQIQKNLQNLKDELKFGLDLRSCENIYVQLTNLNGSTVAPPVTVQASVLSDFGSQNLLPDRLKQLAEVVTISHVENLGLNYSIFGIVKEVVLSSYLQQSISSTGSPSPSPSGEPPYSAASPHALVPSADIHKSPCLYCDIVSPTESPPSYMPLPQNSPQSSPSYYSPGVSIGNMGQSPRHASTSPPRNSPIYSPTSTSRAPSSAITPQYKPLGPPSQMTPAFSPLSSGVNYGSSPLQEKGHSLPVPAS